MERISKILFSDEYICIRNQKPAPNEAGFYILKQNRRSITYCNLKLTNPENHTGTAFARCFPGEKEGRLRTIRITS